jgi:hypothetical protein
VFVTCFGKKSHQPVLLSLLILGGPLGTVVGYAGTAIISDWRLAFRIMAMSMGGCILIVLFTPSQYLDTNKAI